MLGPLPTNHRQDEPLDPPFSVGQTSGWNPTGAIDWIQAHQFCSPPITRPPWAATLASLRTPSHWHAFPVLGGRGSFSFLQLRLHLNFFPFSVRLLHPPLPPSILSFVWSLSVDTHFAPFPPKGRAMGCWVSCCSLHSPAFPPSANLNGHERLLQ